MNVKRRLKRVKKHKIAIVYRPERPDARDNAKKLAHWLIERKISVYKQTHQKISDKCRNLTRESQISQLSLVIVLGGDGTYLNAVQMLKGRQVPILGVNMGSLGFLTTTRIDELYQAVIDTLEGRMELRPRTMFKVVSKPKRGKAFQALALNDVVIERGSAAQLIGIDVFNDTRFVCELKGDGIIVATPTGSTAYNLAAGGPILHPEVPAISITPIAPHSLTSRPMVFGDDLKIRLVVSNPTRKAILSIDGKTSKEVSGDEEVIITKFSQPHYVVRPPTHNYFDLLREKLQFGQRD